MQTLRISGIIEESIVDGNGLRFVVFAQGCPHNCKGCHNVETHDFNGGNEVKISTIIERVSKNALISGVTFSGGEPFCQAEALCTLAKEVLDLGKDIVIYSGYTIEELLALSDPFVRELLSYATILVDGRYVEEERDLMLKFRGSRNQRIIDTKASLINGVAVEREW